MQIAIDISSLNHYNKRVARVILICFARVVYLKRHITHPPWTGGQDGKSPIEDTSIMRKLI